MNSTDRQVFFTALGFMAVAMQGKEGGKGSAARAQDFATLIEEFCRTTVPEAFNDAQPSNEEKPNAANVP